jgi:hypothetical protein
VNYLLRNVVTERYLVSDSIAGLALLAGARLKDGTLSIGNAEYHSYAPEAESSFGRDAVRLLCKNHGWTFYRKGEV